MIPILYDSTETAFASNGLGRLRDCINCTVTEERNGIYECDFSYPVGGHNYDLIKLGRIIACEHDDTNDVQPFDIISCTKPINGIVSFHAVHISYRQSKMVASGTNINSLTDAFSMLSSAQPSNPFSYYTDQTGATGYMAAADGTPRSVRQFLGGVEGSILDTYRGEYKWDKWTVSLLSSRGVLRDFTIRYGVDMTDYNEDADYSESYSSVIPFWKGADVTVVGDMQTATGASYNGRNECVPLDLTDKFENKPTKAQLNSRAQSFLNSANSLLPKQSITVSFVRLGDTANYSALSNLYKCSLCDTIKVDFPMYKMQGRFKIVKTVYDVLLERFTEMELGNLSTTLSEALGISNTTTKAPASVVEEEGTSGNWTFRKWSNGKIEAWGTDSKSVACTTASTAYGGYRTASEITWSIPSGIFSGTPNCVFGTKNGANAFKLMNLRATGATQLAGFFGSAASETNTVTMCFYVVQNS